MDMKRIDVSQFMLFEATGDSDAALMDEQFADEDEDDGDDAESCSHEGSETHNWDLGDQQIGGHKSCVADAESQHRNGNKIDEEETAVNGTSYCDDDEVQKRQHRSSLSVESGQQLVDEVEKNRRFWEACLAS